MMSLQKVNGVRILTEERIQNLSPGSLRGYKTAVQKAREHAHDLPLEWCCTPKGPSCSVVNTRDLTPEEIKNIHTFDYACAAVKREVDRRRGPRG